MKKHLQWILLVIMVCFGQAAWAEASDAISKRYGRWSLDFTQLVIRAPDYAESTEVVPVEVSEIQPRDGVYVTDIAIYSDDVYDAPIASFTFEPGGVAYISTRIKLARTSNVYVVARWSDGQVSGGVKNIKYTVAIC